MAQVKTPRYVRERRWGIYTQLATGVVYTSSDVETKILVGYDSVTRNNNPNWRQQIALGANATTSYERSGYTVVKPPILSGDGYYSHPASLKTCECLTMHKGPSFSPYTSDDVPTMDIALARFKRKLKGHYGYKNVMLPVAELRDLRKSIVGAAGLTTGLVNALLTIRKTKGKSAFRYASDAWLTYGFGVAPLVSDAQESAKAIQDYLDRNDHTFRITGTAGKRWSSVTKETGGTGMLTASQTTWLQQHHSLSYRYIGAFNALLESANNYGVASQLGFTFKELPATLWELVPYSWVVDYFGTMGAFLNDTFEVPDGNLKYLVRNRKYTMDATISAQLVKYTGPYYHVYGNHCVPGKVKYYSLTRTPLTTLPRASLRFKTVDEIGTFAVNKLLNLTSLLVKRRL